MDIKAFFNETYARACLDHSDASMDEVAVCLEDLVGRRGRMFDQCCGLGGLVRAFSRRGWEAQGVECVESYVHMGRERGASIALGDATCFIPSHPVDLVVNWFTSFGYGRDERLHKNMCSMAHQSLFDGGLFVIEMYYLPHLFHAYKPCMRVHLPIGCGVEWIERKSSLSDDGRFLEQEWHLQTAQGCLRQSSVLRLYMPHELIDICRSCGFRRAWVQSVFSEPLSLESARCLIVAEK